MRSLEVRFLTTIVQFVMVKMHLDPTGDWREKLADGSYPSPPLNGTAHTWHHSPKQLLWTINNGGTLIGGKMPAFKDILKEEEKTAVLDYLFSLWSDKIKKLYNERFGTNI